MMRYLALLFFCCISTCYTFAQTRSVKGTLSTDSATLKIINVYVDSFPNLAVLFKAERNNGEPVWNLTKEKMKAREDATDCEVKSLEQISTIQPINLGVVIDHSGSMFGDGFFTDAFGNRYTADRNGTIRLLKKGEVIKTPLGHAQTAVNKFIGTFNTTKDYISLIGFSDTVDVKLPLSQNTPLLKATVDSMMPTASTALYDAMIAGLEQIKSAKGIPVLIALTDGNDNSSRATYRDVIKEAKRLDIPIYLVGLGDVNKDTLQLIASETNGSFYYTESPESLDSIYAKISKQVQAFYRLVYLSSNFSAGDSVRQIALSFDVDSLILETSAFKKALPAQLLSDLAKREKQRNYLLFGGIVVVLVIGAGTLLYYQKKKKQDASTPVIRKVFPNPSQGMVTVEYFSKDGMLLLMDMQGNRIKEIAFKAGQQQFDFGGVAKGIYLLQIRSGLQQSNTVRLVIE